MMKNLSSAFSFSVIPTIPPIIFSVNGHTLARAMVAETSKSVLVLKHNIQSKTCQLIGLLMLPCLDRLHVNLKSNMLLKRQVR